MPFWRLKVSACVRNQRGVRNITQKQTWLKSEKTSFRKLEVCPKEIERIINSGRLDVRTRAEKRTQKIF